VKQNGMWGVISRTGDIIIPVIFGNKNEIMANYNIKFFDGIFGVRYGERWDLIDYEGKYIGFTQEDIFKEEERIKTANQDQKIKELEERVKKAEKKASRRNSSSSSSNSSSNNQRTCILCGNSGWAECAHCGGDGIYWSMFSGDETCTSCGGRGTQRCYSHYY